MEDQAVEVVGDVGQRHFGFRPRDADGLRIPDYPAGHSSDIRPPKPGYPATLI